MGLAQQQWCPRLAGDPVTISLEARPETNRTKPLATRTPIPPEAAKLPATALLAIDRL
jgi:hypothetical protein